MERGGKQKGGMEGKGGEMEGRERKGGKGRQRSLAPQM